MTGRYSLAGRDIMRDGKRIARISRPFIAGSKLALDVSISPAELDVFAREIVDALNTIDFQRLREEQMRDKYSNAYTRERETD